MNLYVVAAPPHTNSSPKSETPQILMSVTECSRIFDRNWTTLNFEDIDLGRLSILTDPTQKEFKFHVKGTQKLMSF
jgi:hypothetical protein